MKQVILRFGLMAVALFALLQLGQYSIFRSNKVQEWQISLFAILFIAFGIYIANLFFKRKQSSAEEHKELDLGALEKLGISKREYEVLQFVKEGLSNQEIAKQLYISESTVKTHVSNLLVKLDAKRRTQAVSRAEELKIL